MLPLNKIKQYSEIAYRYVNQLRDVRFAGQVIFVVIVLLVSWSGVKAIDANYALQKQITTIQQQNEIQKLENNNINLQNQYFKSNQYLELSARQNFGLAAPGETELIVPKNVALSYTVPEPKVASSKPVTKSPLYERNLRAWVNFFLDRKQATD
ncbi:MAG: septum formation initiator family protein [Candidatus Saccharimonadales bacterium]